MISSINRTRVGLSCCALVLLLVSLSHGAMATEYKAGTSLNPKLRFPSDPQYDISYQQCESPEVLGVKIGQSIADIAAQIPLKMPKAQQFTGKFHAGADKRALRGINRALSAVSYPRSPANIPFMESFDVNKKVQLINRTGQMPVVKPKAVIDEGYDRHLTAASSVGVRFEFDPSHPAAKGFSEKYGIYPGNDSHLIFDVDLNGRIWSIKARRKIYQLVDPEKIKAKLKLKYGPTSMERLLKNRNPGAVRNQALVVDYSASAIPSPNARVKDRSYLRYDLRCKAAKAASHQVAFDLMKAYYDFSTQRLKQQGDNNVEI